MNTRPLISILLVGAASTPALAETTTQTIEFDADTIFENVEVATSVPFTLQGTFDKFNPAQGELLFVIFEAEAAFTFTINIDFFGGADVGVGGDIFADNVEISGLGGGGGSGGSGPTIVVPFTAANNSPTTLDPDDPDDVAGFNAFKGTGEVMVEWRATATMDEDPETSATLELEGGGDTFFKVTYEFEPGQTCTGDIDGNGSVGFNDLSTLLGMWGDCPSTGPCPGDIDGNGSVGFNDLSTLLGNWGPC